MQFCALLFIASALAIIIGLLGPEHKLEGWPASLSFYVLLVSGLILALRQL